MRNINHCTIAVPGVLTFMVSQKSTVTGPTGRPASVTNWVCKLCGYSSKYKHVCTEHMYYKHRQDENLPCEYCGLIFPKRPALRKHKIKCMSRCMCN